MVAFPLEGVLNVELLEMFSSSASIALSVILGESTAFSSHWLTFCCGSGVLCTTGGGGREGVVGLFLNGLVLATVTLFVFPR